MHQILYLKEGVERVPVNPVNLGIGKECSGALWYSSVSVRLLFACQGLVT